MFKKLIKFGVCCLLILLSFTATAFADSKSDNSFASYDKEYEERLKTAKGMPDEQFSIQNSIYDDEMHRKESNVSDFNRKRYIVKFIEDATMEQIFDMVSLYNYKILGNSENRMFVLEIDNVVSFSEQTSEIVEFIEEDVKKEAKFVPTDTFYKYQWSLPAVKIPEAWNYSTGSNSVYVAVIDSGIYRSHPDLINADIRNGWDYIFNEYCDWDSTSHGTKITGIIGAETNNSKGIAGINWNVALIPFRVMYSDGTAYTSDIITAIYDAANLNCDVINLSLGNSQYLISEKQAISYAVSKGCIVVASAGNDGNSEYKYPASYDDVISVGSIGSNNIVSSFSQHNNKVDVIAPGENIFTTTYWIDDYYGNDYAFVDGTSFAGPYVSGIAALMSAAKPSITANEFMNLLKITSTDLGPSGYDNFYGYGLINAEEMLQSVSNIPIQYVTLNKTKITLNAGDSYTLKATILPSNSTNQNVTWKSSNPLVATIYNGIVTAINNGSTIITVTTNDGGKTASCLVNVESAIVKDLDLFNPIANTRHSFNNFVDSPYVFDDVVKNLNDYLIAYDRNYYRVNEIQARLNNGAAHFEEAIQGLIPVDIDKTSDLTVINVSVINKTLTVGDEYALPFTVDVTVDDKEKTIEMEVEWDGIIDTTRPRDYTFTGTLILPKGYINPNKIVAIANITVKSKSGPITIDQIPYGIEILPPNNIGTIWMETTYKNNTDYPITGYQMKILLKDENKTTYLSNYDTVLPEQTSPIFDTIGPKSMKISDIEVLTIDISLESPNGKRLRVEYDKKLNKYEYSEYNSDFSDNSPIMASQVPYDLEILQPNSIGTVWMQATYKNNTDYPITSYMMKLLLKDKNETTYLSNYDTVLPGETSPIFDTIGPNTMNINDVEILTIDYRAEISNGKTLRIEYNAKLNKYEYSEY